MGGRQVKIRNAEHTHEDPVILTARIEAVHHHRVYKCKHQANAVAFAHYLDYPLPSHHDSSNLSLRSNAATFAIVSSMQ